MIGRAPHGCGCASESAAVAEYVWSCGAAAFKKKYSRRTLVSALPVLAGLGATQRSPSPGHLLKGRRRAALAPLLPLRGAVHRLSASLSQKESHFLNNCDVTFSHLAVRMM